jgi:hypothetical protein
MSKKVYALASALWIAACSGSADAPVADNAATGTNASLDASASSEAKAAQPETPSAPAYTLAGNGLSPGLTFGMAQAEAIAAATKAFGAPGKPEHNDECGEGPMDFVSFHDLQLGFQEGKLAGWTLSGTTPALKTAGGITFGTPRKSLGKIEIDEQSSLGPEFSVDDVGGVLGEGDKVVSLWAGQPCQFR